MLKSKSQVTLFVNYSYNSFDDFHSSHIANRNVWTFAININFILLCYGLRQQYY